MAKRQLDPFFVAARDSIPKPHAHGPVAVRIDVNRDSIINMDVNNFYPNLDFPIF